jgi:cytochrome c-type protein NapB
MQRAERRKYIRIGLTALCMIVAVFVLGAALRKGGTKAIGHSRPLLMPEILAGEAETFRLAEQALTFANSAAEKNTKRNLEVFDSRRAFPGAPPVIPHALLEDRTMGGNTCLGCHTDGGYVPVFKAYAPITPHPQMENCRQCHVPQNESPLFAGMNWQKMPRPAIDQEALPGGPPPIPHALEMRENCLACHAGPGAVAEIRTPHPERVNCRQCHVPAEETDVFDRGGLR